MKNHKQTPILFYVEKDYPESEIELHRYKIETIELIFNANNKSYHIRVNLRDNTIKFISINDENMTFYKVEKNILYWYQFPSKKNFNKARNDNQFEVNTLRGVSDGTVSKAEFNRRFGLRFDRNLYDQEVQKNLKRKNLNRET
jgi:hypothetical protein